MIFTFDKAKGDFKYHPWWEDAHTSEVSDAERAIVEKHCPNYLNDAIEIRRYEAADVRHRTTIVVVKQINPGVSIVGRLFWLDCNVATYW